MRERGRCTSCDGLNDCRLPSNDGSAVLRRLRQSLSVCQVLLPLMLLLQVLRMKARRVPAGKGSI